MTTATQRQHTTSRPASRAHICPRPQTSTPSPTSTRTARHNRALRSPIRRKGTGSGGWSGWLSLGGTAVSNITWAPGVNGAVQEVFARTSDGAPWENIQTSSGWSGWTGLGGTIASNITDAPGSVGSVLELFAVNSAGTPYENWLTPSAWNGWVSRGGTLASDITEAPGSIGSAQEIFGINSAGTVYENWESSGGSWSGWHSLGP